MRRITDQERYDRAIGMIDQANAADPQAGTWRGREGPREVVFTEAVCDWLCRLEADASEELLLAARAHTLCRWEVLRSAYPMTTPGYHRWRHACALHHAEVAERILRTCGYGDEIIEKVSALILKKNWPADTQAQALEDADCLAFLEMKLASYVDEWDPDKTVKILRRTLRKMTPKAKGLAGTIPLDPRCAELLRRAQSVN